MVGNLCGEAKFSSVGFQDTDAEKLFEWHKSHFHHFEKFQSRESFRACPTSTDWGGRNPEEPWTVTLSSTHGNYLQYNIFEDFPQMV